MADAAAQLDILIQLGVIGEEDVKAANDLLEQTSQNTTKFGKAGKEASEGLKLMEFHGGEFRKLVHELDAMVPGVGLALKAAFNPATLGLGVTVMLIERVKEALDEYNKKLDEAGEAAAKADFAESIHAAAEATRDANEEQEKYLANLHEIEKGEHGIAVELSRQLSLTAAIAAARQSAADAAHTLALAKLKEQETSGSLTPTQAALERQKVEDKYIADKRAAEEDKFKKDQQARTQAAVDAANKQGELERKEIETAEALARAQRQKERGKNLPDYSADIKKNIEDLDAASEKLKQAQQDVQQGAYGPEERKRHLQNAQDEYDAAKRRLDLANQLDREKRNAEQLDLGPLEEAARKAREEAKNNATAQSAAAAARDQAQREHDATQDYRNSSDRSATNTDASNTRAELMDRARVLQKEFADQGAGMSHANMMELLQLIRLLGEKVFEQGQGAVTRQEFRREVQSIRRLIESKK